MRKPYPLAWPKGTPRTKAEDRRRSNFSHNRGRVGQISAYEAAKSLHAELGRMRAINVVITSQLPTRHDGFPYSDGAPSDPGIAVWFTLGGIERVFACDAWKTPGENMRALQNTIDAMRGVGRWGVASAEERIFAGFAALPPGSSGTVAPGPPPPPPWREVIGGTWPELDNADLLAIAKARHRAAIQKAHPDAGGSHELAASLNAALAAAELELGATP